MKFNRILGGAFGVFLLAACSGGSGDSSDSGNQPPPTSDSTQARFSCQPVGGGTATLAQSCIACWQGALAEREKAIDTRLDTAATLQLYNPQDTAGQQSIIQLTATAQPGVVFPAGSRPGLILGLPNPRNVPFLVQLQTCLADSCGEPQSRLSTDIDGDIAYLDFSQPQASAFDAVRVSFAQIGGALETQNLKLYEFCADGSAR